MEGQQSLRFHQKDLHLCSDLKMNEILTGLQHHEGEWLHFWVNYPFK